MRSCEAGIRSVRGMARMLDLALTWLNLPRVSNKPAGSRNLTVLGMNPRTLSCTACHHATRGLHRSEP